MKYNLWKREINKYWFDGFNMKPHRYRRILSTFIAIILICLISCVTFRKDPIKETHSTLSVKLYKLDPRVIRDYQHKIPNWNYLRKDILNGSTKQY